MIDAAVWVGIFVIVLCGIVMLAANAVAWLKLIRLGVRRLFGK